MVATSAAADSNLQISFRILEEELHYSLRSNPPWHEAVTMAFQHVIVMLGTIVMVSTPLVRLMGGNDEDKAIVIQTLLLTSGLNTLLQTLIGTRLPTVMSASTTFIIPVTSIIKDMSKYSFTSEHEAWAYFTRFLSPISVIPIICLEGLGKSQSDGFPKLGECIEIGLPMLILLVVFQQYMKFIGGKKNCVFEKFGVLFSVTIVWAFAALLTVSGAYNHVSEQTKFSCRVDRSNIMSASRWVRIPHPFQWGAPIFKASPIFGMIGAALVSTSESTGIYYAAARFSGATPPPDNVLTRSVGLQGLGMLFDGLFGAVVATDVSVENAGLLGLTRVGNRRVVQISTIFMIFFSIFGKFGGLFASIPIPMFAAIHSILFSIIYATDNGRERVRRTSLWFNDILKTTFSSAPTVVTAFGTVVGNTLDTKNTENERGLPSWRKFQKYDPEGFYKFPPPIGPRRRPPASPSPSTPPSKKTYMDK
ncbi:hypothetical protein C5167_035096 [Papaver somniferum]|uniref:Uncharacterized protein n=1 Tax=Papaver somniferum TaxID=3469 RepID=A0A4Y7KEY0_PAPSO|nr:hypothetical protein C5167_035096 [Papaver somniferum]